MGVDRGNTTQAVFSDSLSLTWPVSTRVRGVEIQSLVQYWIKTVWCRSKDHFHWNTLHPVPPVPRWSQKWAPHTPRLRRPCLYVCTKFKADSSIRSKGISRVPKFGNWVTWPRPRPLNGRFMVHTQEESVLYVCTKFEADSPIRSKVIRGYQNIEIGSRDAGHAQLGLVLWCTRRRGPSSMSVPSLNRIGLFIQML